MKKLITFAAFFVAFATFILMMTPAAFATAIGGIPDLTSNLGDSDGPGAVTAIGALGAVVILVLLVVFGIIGGCIIKGACGTGGAGGGTNMGGLNCFNACEKAGIAADCAAQCGM